MPKIAPDPTVDQPSLERMYFKVSKSDNFEAGWHTLEVGKGLLSSRVRRLMHEADVVYLVDRGDWSIYRTSLGRGDGSIYRTSLGTNLWERILKDELSEIEKAEIILSAQEI